MDKEMFKTAEEELEEMFKQLKKLFDFIRDSLEKIEDVFEDVLEKQLERYDENTDQHDVNSERLYSKEHNKKILQFVNKLTLMVWKPP